MLFRSNVTNVLLDLFLNAAITRNSGWRLKIASQTCLSRSCLQSHRNPRRTASPPSRTSPHSTSSTSRYSAAGRMLRPDCSPTEAARPAQDAGRCHGTAYRAQEWNGLAGVFRVPLLWWHLVWPQTDPCKFTMLDLCNELFANNYLR